MSAYDYFKGNNPAGLPLKENNKNMLYGYPFVLLIPYGITKVKKGAIITDLDWSNPHQAVSDMFDSDGKWWGMDEADKIPFEYIIETSIPAHKISHIAVGMGVSVAPIGNQGKLFAVNLDTLATDFDAFIAGTLRVGSIVADDNNLFVNKYTDNYKLNNTDFSEEGSVYRPASLGTNALVLDEEHIYLNSSSSAIAKWDKNSLDFIGTTPNWSTGKSGVAGDDDYIYTLKKVSNTSLSLIRTLKSDFPNTIETSVDSITVDDTSNFHYVSTCIVGGYLYLASSFLAGSTRPVWKFDLTTFTKSAEEGETYGNYAGMDALVSDGDYLYIGGIGGAIKKYDLSDFTASPISFPAGYGANIESMKINGDYLYVGGAGGVLKVYNKNTMGLEDESGSLGTTIHRMCLFSAETVSEEECIMKTLGMLSDAGVSRESNIESVEFRNIKNKLIFRKVKKLDKTIDTVLYELGDIEIENFVNDSMSQRYIVIVGQAVKNADFDYEEGWYKSGSKLRYRCYLNSDLRQSGNAVDSYNSPTLLPVRFTALPLRSSINKEIVIVKDYDVT